MKYPLIAASALTTAVGLALAAQTPAVRAQGANPPQVVKDNMARAAANKLEKCYGINAAAKNDCAEGAHSCAGQSTTARDPRPTRRNAELAARNELPFAAARSFSSLFGRRRPG
jgi:uncharacterized membrane protein